MQLNGLFSLLTTHLSQPNPHHKIPIFGLSSCEYVQKTTHQHIHSSLHVLEICLFFLHGWFCITEFSPVPAYLHRSGIFLHGEMYAHRSSTIPVSYSQIICQPRASAFDCASRKSQFEKKNKKYEPT